MSTRLILSYGDVTTDLRTDVDPESFDALATFMRIVWDRHTAAISFAVAVEEAVEKARDAG